MYNSAQLKQEKEAINHLGASMLIQAARDYLSATEPKKKAILKELNSDWDNFLTDGKARRLAEKLQSNPKEVKKIIKQGTTILRN